MNNSIEYKLKKKNRLNMLADIFMVIAIIYNSGSALMTVNNTIGVLLLSIAYILGLSRYLKVNRRVGLNLFNITFFLIIMMTIISFMINLSFTYINSYIRYVLIISFAFLFVKYIEFGTFVKYYITTMKFIVVSSLIPFFLINYLSIDFLGRLPLIENINGVKYYNGILFYYYTYTSSRNMGVFWEPSIFSTFIIFAMVYEICFKREKTSYINLGIFTIGLLTSQSSGGLLLLLLIPLLVFFKRTSTFKSLFLQILLLASWLIMYANSNRILSVLRELFPRIFLQFDLGKESSSIAHRLGAPIGNIELFLNNPFFGLGLGKVDIAFSQYMISQTSTSTYYLATFGFLGIIFTLVIIYGVMKSKEQTIISRIIITLIILIAVNKEPHFWFVGTYIIIFYFIKPRSPLKVN